MVLVEAEEGRGHTPSKGGVFVRSGKYHPGRPLSSAWVLAGARTVKAQLENALLYYLQK